MLGKMRMGPDLSNIGKRAPVEDASPAPAESPAANAPPPTTAASPAAAPNSSPAASPSASITPASSPAAAPGSSPATSASASSAPATAPAPAPTTTGTPAADTAVTAETSTGPNGIPPQYSAAWHHQHLYSPRSVLPGTVSNMPAYKFLYEKRRITGERSVDALKLTGEDAPGDEWEIVPSYDAKCLVAYLMSLDQSHDLKEAKMTSTSAPASSPAPPPAASPAAAPATSPAPAKEEKK
jgi:hypothetical protein